MGVLLLLAAVASTAVRPAPSVPPAGATGHASVTILSAVEIGASFAAPAQSHQARSGVLTLADGSTRPLLTYEFE